MGRAQYRPWDLSWEVSQFSLFCKFFAEVLYFNQYDHRCLQLHQNKIDNLSKPQDVKKLAKTIEFELERKKNEKLKNHEFLNQGNSQYNDTIWYL